MSLQHTQQTNPDVPRLQSTGMGITSQYYIILVKKKNIAGYFGLQSPKLEHLEYVTNKTTGASFRLMDKIATKWKIIGLMLGMEYDHLNEIGKEWNTNFDRLADVLAYWQANDNPHHDTYPHSWQGLRTLLNDAGATEIANQYFDFLSKI